MTARPTADDLAAWRRLCEEREAKRPGTPGVVDLERHILAHQLADIVPALLDEVERLREDMTIMTAAFAREESRTETLQERDEQWRLRCIDLRDERDRADTAVRDARAVVAALVEALRSADAQGRLQQHERAALASAAQWSGSPDGAG